MGSDPAMNAPDSTLTFTEYRTLVEQSPILIWRAGLDMGCDYFNGRWLAFTGRSLEQEYGNGWAEGVHPEDLPRCLGIYTGCFKKRQAFEMEYRLRRADGAYRWIFDRGVPYFGMAGEFLGFIGSCIDVTERVEAQEAIRQAQEEELKALHGLLPICCQCKRIRDDAGGWNQLEGYIKAHSKADFTHGYCPECAEQALDEMKRGLDRGRIPTT
jgi:PAS domain S-box-containing protein